MCKYTNGSIPPGQKGELTYSAPTKGRLGRFKKSITVIFSSGEHIVLITTGEVIGDSKATTKIDSVFSRIMFLIVPGNQPIANICSLPIQIFPYLTEKQEI